MIGFTPRELADLRRAWGSLSARDRSRFAAERDELAETLRRVLECEHGEAAASVITEALGPTGRGAVVVMTPAARQVMVWARDGGVPIPPAWAKYARFTLAELRLLVEGTPLSADDIQGLLDVKDVFRGVVVGGGACGPQQQPLA